MSATDSTAGRRPVTEAEPAAQASPATGANPATGVNPAAGAGSVTGAEAATEAGPAAGLAISPAVEDYCKAIFTLQSRTNGAPVSTNALAQRLSITPGSVSAMVRRLGELGLTEHVPYRGVTLTSNGRRIALEVIRHHRLIELFLAETLQMPWDRVHAEAEVLEHVISEELEQLIAEKLGDPTIDPHGDPIPTAQLELPEAPTCSLDSLQAGQSGEFVRVSDSDPEMLRYLSQRGIAPGRRLHVIERQPFGGPLLVSFEGERQAIGGMLAKAMRVQLDAEAMRARPDAEAPPRLTDPPQASAPETPPR